MPEICQVCGEEGNDRRTLKLRYLYQLSEISTKFQAEEDCYYSLLTCKDCRGDFLSMLRRWTKGEFVQPLYTAPDANIPVRVDGRTVLMTEEEYNNYRKKKEHGK